MLLDRQDRLCRRTDLFWSAEIVATEAWNHGL
jgi:hypothetical protein